MKAHHAVALFFGVYIFHMIVLPTLTYNIRDIYEHDICFSNNANLRIINWLERNSYIMIGVIVLLGLYLTVKKFFEEYLLYIFLILTPFVIYLIGWTILGNYAWLVFIIKCGYFIDRLNIITLCTLVFNWTTALLIIFLPIIE